MSDPKDIYRRYCTCTHLELSHDLNAKGVRTFCWHIEGPRGVRCECKRFTLPTTGT